MLETIPLDGPVDLAALDEFLASDSAPACCMQLSELDGFLAGIAVGPELILPSVWLPMVWREESEPVFNTLTEAQTMLGIILRRYNEIVSQADTPGAYQPVLVEHDNGGIDPSDWAVGFIQAVGLCQDAWERLAGDAMAASLMIPVILFASMTHKAHVPLDEDERLPETEMAKLVAEAGPTISLCISGMRAFFRGGMKSDKRKRTRKTKQKRR
jgi:uncharacterized protein